MLVTLKGRIAIVTGAGSGIGRSVAISLAQAGANVAALDRDLSGVTATADSINKLRPNSCLPLQVDVTEQQSIESAVKESKQGLQGILTCAVNCAGITADGFMLKMNGDQWDKVLSVNLKGTFLVTQAVSRAIIEDGAPLGGSIVNISSIIGKIGNLGQANYAASKGGVISFSKTAAKELARNNIRVNSVLPGFINTPMAQAVPQKVLDKMVAEIPLNRMGDPEEIANVCTFLCSDKSSFITGAAIEVTGGQCM